MKRSSIKLNISFFNIKDVYDKKVRINTRNKDKIGKFDDFYSINLFKVKGKFDNSDYKFLKYDIFLIKEPKYRIIMSQNISDKLFNHVVSDKILLPVLDKCLINTNVATRKNKGTLCGIRYLKKYLNELKGGRIYALKFDISKYFYNIDHDILFDLLKRKYKDKEVLKLFKYIIDSTDCDYINKDIIKIKENEIFKIRNSNISDKQKEKLINEIKRIPLYEKGKGLPIGNMSSQILAVFYLNELDHYIKEKLHIKYYIRYMDDGVILSDSFEYLKYCLDEIKYILDKYKLSLNNKTKIINVNKEGIDFLGFHFYIIKNKVVMKVRNGVKRNFRRKMRLVRKGKISNKVISSYKGHFKHGNCFKLYKSEMDKF